MNRRVGLSLLAIALGCEDGETSRAGDEARTDTTPMIADTQFVRDSSGVDLLIITRPERIEAIVPRKGAADGDAPGAYRLLSARLIHDRMKGATPAWRVLDLRTARDFVAGHVPGAILTPADRLEENVGDLQVRTDQFLLVYGTTTEEGRAAAELLASYGFPNLIVMQGGFGAWQRSGLEPETPSP